MVIGGATPAIRVIWIRKHVATTTASPVKLRRPAHAGHICIRIRAGDMFSDNTKLVDKNVRKDVENRLWIESYIENYMKNQYDGFMKGFYEKLSKKINDKS